jgi:hypothetical protein
MIAIIAATADIRDYIGKAISFCFEWTSRNDYVSAISVGTGGIGMSGKAVEVVERYWQLMMSNDFQSVGAELSDDFAIDWP